MMMMINRLCTVRVLAVYLVDIFNMIEAFREAGLSCQDCATKVPLDVLEMLLNCVFCALNKRLPNSAQIDVSDSVQSLFGFLVCAYDVYVVVSSSFLARAATGTANGPTPLLSAARFAKKILGQT